MLAPKWIGAIKLCLGATYSLDVHDIFLITEPYSASNLKKVAKAVAKLYFSPEMKDDFVAILGRFGKFSTLRNHIAHNNWTDGSRPNSIRIVQADIRAGRLDLKGYSEDEPDYTLDELGDAANDGRKNARAKHRERFVTGQYLHSKFVAP